MRYHRKTKRDANHREIVNALEQCGCSVLDLAAVGGGCPDVLVATYTSMVLMEIKRPGVAGKKRGAVQNETNKKQADFKAAWRGKIETVESIHDALRAIGIAV